MKNPNLYIVPYSDHCSYTELVQFVYALRPSKVVPIVTGTKDRFNMSCFDAYLSQPHAVSANATNQFSSHSETQILLGGIGYNTSAIVKGKKLTRRSKPPAKGVVYCEDSEL